jgi:hypothetical protein
LCLTSITLLQRCKISRVVVAQVPKSFQFALNMNPCVDDV